MLGLTVYSRAALDRATPTQLCDSLAYFSPDAVLVPSDADRYQVRRAINGDIPVVAADSRARSPREVASVDGVQLLVVPTADSLSVAPDAVDPTAETYLLSDHLALEVNPTRLETTLTGRAEYAEQLPPALDGCTHLTVGANPDYRKTWGALDVQGVMPGTSQAHADPGATVAHLSLGREGLVTTTARDLSAFGLEALTQVGRTRAETLRNAGFETPAQVADATVTELRELSGFGRSTAETVNRSATAFVDGEVYRVGNGQLPTAEPVFVDIETDGLNPTMVPLIGVLDREGGETYRSFLARDPDEPGEAVEAFASWLARNADDRPVVAYHGNNFDFPVLEEQIEAHCPEYLDAWQETRTFDPYYWAVTDEQAILPGRTNKLEDVAPALGWETIETGLSGEAVARLFQAYMANPCPATEPDWERHERYCEDDVRSLAFVYDALADAETRLAERDTSTADTTAQGRLSDF